MLGPFDIVANDILRLDDTLLRDVLNAVLVAEGDAHGLPASAVTAGGNQNAKDGGVDARVEWSKGPAGTAWLPRHCTVFQCKAESMTPSKLKREMRPHDQARPIFAELAEKGGAYIVFAADDCSDSALQERRRAMRAALADVPGGEAVELGFYGADQIARWVNGYAGVASCVRDLAGRSMAGWRPFENWSAPEQGQKSVYLIDDEPKVTVSGAASEPITVLAAIERIRNQLLQPERAVRLVGVSGVGKTRLAQALFDSRVCGSALNSALAVYADLGLSPASTATQVAEQLVQAGRRAILIVDNCPGDTHRALVAITQRSGTQVSLLSIDFDVGLDQPDKTLVVQLHKNGNQLIEALLKSRVPGLSPLDLHRVRDFAEGNARVALKIAESATDGGSLADLPDLQIIDRLFLDGRRPTDDAARRCAEAASLVYAFHVEQEREQPPEHPVLAELAEVSPIRMYRAIADFVERGTAQKRGTQRAILPQALAIRLATQALERLPADVVLTQFNQAGRERLFKSFTRRLGQLHTSASARHIVESLLGDGMMLADPSLLSSYGLELFENVAPAAPDAVLAALERATFGPRSDEFTSLDYPHRWRLTLIARNLAYETAHFSRAARVLLAMAKREPEDHRHNPVRPHFLELFWIGLSFTTAPPNMRFAFLDELLADADEEEKRLAVAALDYTLTTGTRTSSLDFDFGARPRGTEWRPATYDEQRDWFRRALRRLTQLAVQQGDLAKRARVAIEGELRGLIRIGLTDDLVKAVTAIRGTVFWPEGWKHLCMAMHFDRELWLPETQAKIIALENQLRPMTIEERFETFVTNEPWGLYDPNPADPDEIECDMSGLALELGKEVVGRLDLSTRLAERACSYVGQSNCYAFGRGLAEGASDHQAVWQQLTAVFSEVQEQRRNPALLTGFVHAASKTMPAEVHCWLDEAVGDEALGPHIVALSFFLPIDSSSIERLTRAVPLGRAPIHSYAALAGGSVLDGAPADALAAFLQVLATSSIDGVKVATGILHMHLYSVRKKKHAVAPAFIALGQELLCTPYLYQRLSTHDGYGLSVIARLVLGGAENEDIARRICELIVEISGYAHSRLPSIEQLCRTLAELHPRVVLDAVLRDDDIIDRVGRQFFGRVDDDGSEHSHRSIPAIDPMIVLDWARENPGRRAVRAAKVVPYAAVDEKGTINWTRIALDLTALPGVGLRVLEEFRARFGIGIGFGPWHNRFVRRRPLLETLTRHDDPAVRDWAVAELYDLDQRVARMKEQERRRDERFE